MQAVRVLRFSGPRAHAELLFAMAASASIHAQEIAGRGGREDCWVELAIPVNHSAGVDDEQVARSMERTVERLDAGFRLREYLTEIRAEAGEAAAGGPA